MRFLRRQVRLWWAFVMGMQLGLAVGDKSLVKGVFAVFLFGGCWWASEWFWKTVKFTRATEKKVVRAAATQERQKKALARGSRRLQL